jgi:hypothetical protein
MNLEVRTTVLEHSLKLENALNKILIGIIDVKSSDPKTLGHKSSALSFSSKANLLYDLEKITKEEYSLLFCFMEIRNQFIHNLDSDSFTKVVERINKKKIFLDSDPHTGELIKKEDNTEIKERLYSKIYHNFYRKLIDLLIKQYESLLEVHRKKYQSEIDKIKAEYREQVNIETAKMQEDLFITIGESIEEASDIMEKTFDKAFNLETGFSLKFQGMINKFFSEKIKEKYPNVNLSSTEKK